MAVVIISARRAGVVPCRRWFPMVVSLWFATVFVLFTILFAAAGEPPAT
jgi:hypothetical protein